MIVLARVLRLLSMVVWVGGLIFFAFVEAPTAFHVMGTSRQFALLIGGSINLLNKLGYWAGAVFMIATLPLRFRETSPRAQYLLWAEMALVFVMMGAAMTVQTQVVPAMERDRAAIGGDITTVPPNNPVRTDFDHLHDVSEKVEGTALFLGLGVVVLMGLENTSARAAEPA
jgi:uncharacterized membrane protein